jgi:uncharacterized delta-60 repeat protein
MVALLCSATGALASFGHHGKRVISHPGVVRETISYGGSRTLLVADLSPDQELVRLRANGSLDRSFGNNGRLDIPAEAVAVRPNGKILVLATEPATASGGTDAVLTQLLPDGSPDGSFGPSGEVAVDLGNRYDEGTAMALLPDGKIMVAGVSGSRIESRFGVVIGDAVLTRLRSDGSLDPSFGVEGRVTVSSASYPSALKLGPDSTLYLQDGEAFYRLFRLTADGAPDPTFGLDGAATIPWNWALEGREKNFFPAGEWAVLANGGVLLGGTVSWSVNDQLRYKVGVLRLAGNGFPKSSYGDDGLVQVGFPGWTFGNGLAATANGRAVAVASSQHPVGKKSRLAAIALTAAGHLDKRFGRQGKTRIEFDDWAGGESILLRGEKVLLVGGGEGNQTLLAQVPLVKQR